MSFEGVNHGYCRKTGIFAMPTTSKPEMEVMSKGERKRVLLKFLAEHNLALPPAAIHRNLRLHERLFISDSTLENYLNELVEEELVVRVEPDPLIERDVIELGLDEEGRAYYLVTQKGRNTVLSDKEDSLELPHES